MEDKRNHFCLRGQEPIASDSGTPVTHGYWSSNPLPAEINAAGYEPAVAIIATEMAPQDQSWDQLCKQENIILVWPQVAKEKFIEAVETMGIGKNL